MPAGASAPAGAAPPLAYQIAAAGSIVLCTTEIAGEMVSYRVREVWKGSTPSINVGETLRLDTRTHELLGYRPGAGQDVVLFFVARGLLANQPVEVLPVVNGGVTYSPHDRSVQENLTLGELKQRIAGGDMAAPENIPAEGLALPLRISFIGLKSLRWVSLAHNNFSPSLVLFQDHLVQKVVFAKPRKYSEIEYVDVSVTDTENLDIAYANSWFTFSCKLKAREDLVKALNILGRKGVQLGDGAKRLLAEAGR